MLVAALAAFFWAFSFEYLSPSRHFLLMWLLPIASGFACGCFSGSLKVSGPVGSFLIAATGGFAVWLLSYYLLPAIPDQKGASSQMELEGLLGATDGPSFGKHLTTRVNVGRVIRSLRP
jgi:hypothetical protein